jgi:hypothetical protein
LTSQHLAVLLCKCVLESTYQKNNEQNNSIWKLL